MATEDETNRKALEDEINRIHAEIKELRKEAEGLEDETKIGSVALQISKKKQEAMPLIKKLKELKEKQATETRAAPVSGQKETPIPTAPPKKVSSEYRPKQPAEPKSTPTSAEYKPKPEKKVEPQPQVKPSELERKAEKKEMDEKQVKAKPEPVQAYRPKQPAEPKPAPTSAEYKPKPEKKVEPQPQIQPEFFKRLQAEKKEMTEKQVYRRQKAAEVAAELPAGLTVAADQQETYRDKVIGRVTEEFKKIRYRPGFFKRFKKLFGAGEAEGPERVAHPDIVAYKARDEISPSNKFLRAEILEELGREATSNNLTLTYLKNKRGEGYFMGSEANGYWLKGKIYASRGRNTLEIEASGNEDYRTRAVNTARKAINSKVKSKVKAKAA